MIVISIVMPVYNKEKFRATGEKTDYEVFDCCGHAK